MLRPNYGKGFPMKTDVFIWIKEKILSSSHPQIKPHGSKTFTKPCYRSPTSSLCAQLTNTTAPALHTGVNCVYTLSHLSSTHPSSRAWHILSPCYEGSLALGDGEESRIGAVTTTPIAAAFSPDCGGALNCPRFLSFLANTAFTPKRSF